VERTCTPGIPCYSGAQDRPNGDFAIRRLSGTPSVAFREAATTPCVRDRNHVEIPSHDAVRDLGRVGGCDVARGGRCRRPGRAAPAPRRFASVWGDPGGRGARGSDHAQCQRPSRLSSALPSLKAPNDPGRKRGTSSRSPLRASPVRRAAGRSRAANPRGRFGGRFGACGPSRARERRQTSPSTLP